MKEILELRVDYDYAHLLFDEHEGRNLGTSVRVVEISKDDPRYSRIPEVSKYVEKEFDQVFFWGWKIRRSYSTSEFTSARLLHLKIKAIFEPAGEDCGTIYDESTACRICGVGRIQKGPLQLRRKSIPKKDIAITIAGEIIVSEKFVSATYKHNLKGLTFEKVIFKNAGANYYQPIFTHQLQISNETVAGVDPFDLSESHEAVSGTVSDGYEVAFEAEVYKCPWGHTIGLNLLSEPYVVNEPHIDQLDFFESVQKVGVNRGLLRPESILFCSKKFRDVVKQEKLTGFDFEIAHVV